MFSSSLCEVDTVKKRIDSLEVAQNAGTDPVGLVVRRSRNDLADLEICSWTAFIQEIQWLCTVIQIFF
jgi:hypothetical protein